MEYRLQTGLAILASFNNHDELMCYAQDHGMLRPAFDDEGGEPYAVLKDAYHVVKVGG